jgi:hypothetical protein
MDSQPYNSAKNRLADDKEVADRLSLSKSWVRGQRHKRRNGEPHAFDIDPVMIGTSPRYRVEDVEAFIASLTQANDNGGLTNG